MFKKIVLGLFAVIALCVLGVFGVASTKPDHFRIERKITTKAAPATIYGVVNDFHKWPKWSPWEALDPEMKKTYEGAESGPGSIYTWSGNDKVGEGKMSIVESTPDSRVAMKLEFVKPFQATNDVEILVSPVGDGSEVTWAMSGTNNLMAKVMSLFMNMDQAIGKDFELGLANLKVLAESEPRPVVGDPSQGMNDPNNPNKVVVD